MSSPVGTLRCDVPACECGALSTGRWRTDRLRNKTKSSKGELNTTACVGAIPARRFRLSLDIRVCSSSVSFTVQGGWLSHPPAQFRNQNSKELPISRLPMRQVYVNFGYAGSRRVVFHSATNIFGPGCGCSKGGGKSVDDLVQGFCVRRGNAGNDRFDYPCPRSVI